MKNYPFKIIAFAFISVLFIVAACFMAACPTHIGWVMVFILLATGFGHFAITWALEHGIKEPIL